MTRPFARRAAMLLPVLCLTACATAVAPVQVTRFHRVESSGPVRGTFAIIDGPRAATTSLADSQARENYVVAVSRELGRLGYTAAPAGSARYAVTIDVERQTRAALAARGGPVSVGVGGSTGSYGSGVGVGVGLDLGRLFGGGRGNGDQIVTQLSVRIARPGEAQALWEGRAETEAGARAPAAQPGLAADTLATALFRDFPGASGQTITVP